MSILAENIRAALRRQCTADLLGHRMPAARVADLSSITGAAAALGVTREHLSRVLHGHRHSRRLLRQYAELQKQAA